MDKYKSDEHVASEVDGTHQVSALAINDTESSSKSVDQKKPTIVDLNKSILNTIEMSCSNHQEEECRHGIVMTNPQLCHEMNVNEAESSGQQQPDLLLQTHENMSVLANWDESIRTSEFEQDVKEVIDEIWERIKGNLTNYHKDQNHLKESGDQLGKNGNRKGWRVIHFFISSTFADFFAEREVLIKKVLLSSQPSIQGVRKKVPLLNYSWNVKRLCVIKKWFSR